MWSTHKRPSPANNGVRRPPCLDCTDRVHGSRSANVLAVTQAMVSCEALTPLIYT
jgi:hypothetical protein